MSCGSGASARWPTRPSRWASMWRCWGSGRASARCYLTAMQDLFHAEGWIVAGFTEAMRTPDSTLIFVTPERAAQITKDQVECMGCLSQCRFSNWSQHEPTLRQRQEGRPAQLLHPEDLAVRAARGSDAGGDRAPADVQRAQCLSVRERPVLLERIHPEREAAGRADPVGAVAGWRRRGPGSAMRPGAAMRPGPATRQARGGRGRTTRVGRGGRGLSGVRRGGWFPGTARGPRRGRRSVREAGRSGCGPLRRDRCRRGS